MTTVRDSVGGNVPSERKSVFLSAIEAPFLPCPAWFLGDLAVLIAAFAGERPITVFGAAATTAMAFTIVATAYSATHALQQGRDQNWWRQGYPPRVAGTAVGFAVRYSALAFLALWARQIASFHFR